MSDDPLLLVAAEREEFAGFAKFGELKPLDWPLAYAAEMRWTNSRAILVANGAGPRLARIAAGIAFRNINPRAVVSTGYCGALDPKLRIGQVVSAGTVRYAGGSFPAVSPPRPGGINTGLTMISEDRVAVSVLQKRELRQSGGDAVEMEAAAVAEVAERAGKPFFCIRVVSDEADESLPIDLNLYRDAEGRFDRQRIALAAILNPWRIPDLLRIQRQCRLAACKLGEFFVDSPF